VTVYAETTDRAAERAAFFTAMRAAPDDDAPRLLYADWLDEHGEDSGAYRRGPGGVRATMANIDAALAAIAAGDFCDSGHHYCPEPVADGYRFPSGALLLRDGRYMGPRRLYDALAAIPTGYRPPAAACPTAAALAVQVED
jgi:uncharacterized protein (TIGR02996 family)